jgi:hypothetical protein
MKKARLLLPLFLPFVIPTTAQVDHAPTLAQEQCRADADAWSIPKWAALIPTGAEFQKVAGVIMRDPTVTAKTMDARRTELGVCDETDSVQANRYTQASRAYTVAEMSRMADYMQRHNLSAQFYQEDDQGKR